VIRSRTLFDFARLGWHVLWHQHRRDPKVRYLAARTAVTVASDRPLPVQADGEIIGDTPVTVRLVPGSVRVVVPAV
jgi:diacylglycerol kinase family enzyme